MFHREQKLQPYRLNREQGDATLRHKQNRSWRLNLASYKPMRETSNARIIATNSKQWSCVVDVHRQGGRCPGWLSLLNVSTILHSIVWIGSWFYKPPSWVIVVGSQGSWTESASKTVASLPPSGWGWHHQLWTNEPSSSSEQTAHRRPVCAFHPYTSPKYR